MSSPANPVEMSKPNEFTLTLNKRIVLFLLTWCIQMIYMPTSNRVTGGIEPKLSIDIFPIWSVWVLPYVLCYVLWFGSILWAIFKVDDRSFRSFIAACMFTFALGVSIFIFFPTYVEPVTFAGNDIFSVFLRSIHENWGRYDAFPSGHVYITTLLALFYSRWYPRRRFLWILIVVIISFSTLFTGQHYILDVLGGYLVALAGYYFGLWWGGVYGAPKQTGKGAGKRPGKRIASSSMN